MLDLFQSVGATDIVEIGVAKEALGAGRWRVSVGGREVVVRSAIEAFIKPGEQVVINRTPDARYIIGTTGKLKTINIKEVVVDA